VRYREKQKEIVDGEKHARDVPRSWKYRIMSPLRFMEEEKARRRPETEEGMWR
jgi:hypothetical protein